MTLIHSQFLNYKKSLEICLKVCPTLVQYQCRQAVLIFYSCVFNISQHCSDEESGLNACTSFSNYTFLQDTA